MRKAVKRLRTIVGILQRELMRKLDQKTAVFYQDDVDLFHRVVSQQKKDRHKIYSLDEPQVYCIAKGKDHKPYEYGTKTSIMSTATGGIILSAVGHADKIHDSHMLGDVLAKAHDIRQTAIDLAVCDRGHRGVSFVDGVTIMLPNKALKRDDCYQEAPTLPSTSCD